MSIIPQNGSPFDSIAGEDGRWSARSLQVLMGYSRWENLAPALTRAMTSAHNEGLNIEDHFLGSQEIAGENGAGRRDYRLTRHAAYLLAMNGDPNKPEVAAAQSYFAAKTREAELGIAPREMTKLEALQAAIESEQGRLVAEARVAELEPIAHSWTVLASGDEDYAVADTAKFLSRDPGIQLGRDRLFTVLREYGWACRQGADQKHRAKQYAVERRWLSEIPQSHFHPRTGDLVLDPPQVRVTVKGLHELHKRLGGTAPVQAPLPAAIAGGVR
ncbi:phage antirepressor KilAC domain-containing protein [Streptacidiphilus sp. PAMC 29251]